MSLVVERGVRLDTSGAFYRAESATSRDLAALAAAVYVRDTRAGKPLRVLDAFGGCGSRSARYLERGVASFVHCNEGDPELGETIRANLAPFGARWSVSHEDAHALLLRNEGSYAYELIDVDSFGLSARAISAVMWSVKLGGLLYLTQTDGRAHTSPARCLAAYGAWPSSSSATHAAVNEQALRLLVGRALQEAATHGLAARPLFSLYAKHGPCFRTFLTVERAPHRTPQLEASYGFVQTCGACGQHARLPWSELGDARCANCGAAGSDVRVAGPMYTGPLHDAGYVDRMRALAVDWGDEYAQAAKLLRTFAAEAEVEGEEGDAPFFYHAHSIASRAGLRGPVSLSALEEALRVAGWRAARTHFNRFALKTNAPVEAQVRAARAVAGLVL
jgi:tRNA (guanine26-N2/guanine27-N2)-dimethyltransferase